MAERSRYRPIVSDSAVAFFIAIPRRRQRKLLDRAHELAVDPFVVPDYCSRDSDGHEIAHLLVDDFLFEYWVDHAARAVMITEVEDAE